MFPRTWLTTLLAGAVLLPMAITLDIATAGLFYGLQDLSMARALVGIGVGLGLVWALDLAALTVVVGADALARGNEVDESTPDID